MQKKPDHQEKTVQKKETPLIKELEPMQETRMTISLPLIIIAVAIIASGIFTGYVLAGSGGKSVSLQNKISGGKPTAQKIVGSKDEKTFKDSEEGVLREGGIDGEGTHHLERPGGPSQNIYLTSSLVPLDDYVGKKVKVWGQTFDPGAAGWFMDVGRLELLE